MNLMRTFLALTSSTILALTLSACGISKLGGGGGDGGGGTGGGGACEGPNPSDAQCVTNADCSAGQVCSVDACAPSGCECDEATGAWLCTEDCTPGCVPQAGACRGPNPADGGCATNADCSPDQSCSADACVPSGCECDAATASWLCTADCGPGCVPSFPACPGPDPSAGSCHEDADCDAGQACALDSCQSSHCECDATTGGWVCTDDCAGSCEPASDCLGPNPQGCIMEGCPDGQTCQQAGTCVSSACACDAATGSWVCDADCGGGVCVPTP